MTFVPASTGTGRVETSDLAAAIQPLTCLVTVMLANNETGIIQVSDGNLYYLISYFQDMYELSLGCGRHYSVNPSPISLCEAAYSD